MPHSTKKDRTETPIFEKGKTYEITIVSYGYPELKVTQRNKH